MKVPKYLVWLLGYEVEITRYGVLFLIVTLLETLAVLALTIGNIVLNALSPTPTYASYYLNSVSILVLFIMFYFAIDAVLNENVFQLFGFMIASLVLLLRLVWGAYYQPERWNIITPAAVVGVCFLLQLSISFPMYLNFGWKMYHVVGTNEHLIAMYRLYSVFISLLKLDIAFVLNITLIGLFFIKYDMIASYVGLSVGSAISIIAAPLVVYLGIMRENRIISSIFFLWCLAMPGYIIYKIVDIWTHDNIQPWDDQGRGVGQWTIKILLTIISGASLFVRAVLMILLLFVIRNYGEGLLEVHNKGPQKQSKALFTVSGDGSVTLIPQDEETSILIPPNSNVQ